MKKVCSMALALCCLLSTTVMAASADATFTNSTKLTTTVPAASYVMNIPADQTVAFGATDTKIGNVTITNASGFAEGKNVEVTVTHDNFHSDSVETTISYALFGYTSASSSIGYDSSKLSFSGKTTGGVSEKAYLVGSGSKQGGEMEALGVSITSAAWGKALAGEYTSTITFTSAVVVK